MIERAPRAFATALMAFELLETPPIELALVGHPGAADREALEAALARRFLPNRVVALLDPSAPPASLPPLLRGKGLVAGSAALYVCRDFVCSAPLTDPGALDAALASAR